MSARRLETGSDTIVAVSSASGAGRRAIVRMSGPRAMEVADGLFRPDSGPSPSELPAWSVARGRLDIADFTVPVPALLYLMRAPRSYTREDVVEFHLVGSPPVTSAVLAEITSRDVRLARPGEFTERAYLSGRIDLSQAEAVLKLIHARTEAEERLAVGELTGELSKRIAEVTERLVELLTQVELAIDFSEDEVPLVAMDSLADRLAALRAEIDELRSAGTARTVFSEMPRVGIIGRTNAGKSSLFNRLLERDTAIVTAASGTTRDVLEEELDLDDVRLLLVDTAGEKTPTADLDDIALERARTERERADLLLLVIDASEPLTAIDLTLLDRLCAVPPLPAAGGQVVSSSSPLPLRERVRVRGTSPASEAPGDEVSSADERVSTGTLIVLNKSDLPVNVETERTVRSRELAVSVSCKTGSGLDRLRDEIREALTHGGGAMSGQRFGFNLRQLNSLRDASDALGRASGAASEDLGFEFPASDIRSAVNHLRDLTHPLDEEEILERIFSRFCIGK